ncbi:transporter [Runella rosea]|uniref:Transporter n=1 Tax=Runella rosea TaxID=2259595 RepID=A0A344TJG9_9BACT|nr:AEC family transporter [Runella rosea]AXE18790.1 transporter [Runella rosea]
MINILFLLLCLVLGTLLKKVPALRQDAPLVINNLLLYVCLPAATLLYTSTTRFNSNYALPILMPWISFGGSLLFFQLLKKFVKFHRHSEAVLILTAGIPSVSFVGFPIFELLYGEKGMQIGVLMSQAGSFLVCSTVGIVTASYYANAQTKKWTFLLDVLRFPTFIAFCIALIINFSGLGLPEIVADLLKKLAAPFSMLALISIGMQVDFRDKNINWQALGWGLGYKLILAPLLITLLFVIMLKQRGIIAEMCVLGAALGPMNTIAIIASNYRLNPALAAQMVGVGIPLSLVLIITVRGLLSFFGYF